MLVLALILVETVLVTGYPQFQDKIPNGKRVPSPCGGQNEIWQGVGHLQPEGAGPRNPFGLDFYANGKVWNRALCQKDSDGDGKTNGEELGDPNCTWKENQTSNLASSALSHPGICEPMTSHTCMSKNVGIKCENVSTASNSSCSSFDLPTTQSINITMPRTAIPRNETTYLCMGFKLPNTKKYHLIGHKPVLDNKNMIHHMMLMGCNNTLNGSILSKPETCLMGMPTCQTIIGIWGPGSQGECYPKEFGFPIGESGFEYAVLQVHWNNPLHEAGQFDASGMTLYYTSELRPNDGMVVMAGQAQFSIPPRQANFTIEGSCTKECSSLIKPTSVNISAVFLHMHLLGKAGKIELMREGEEPMLLVEEKSYDYNAPIMHSFDNPVAFHAGDEIKVTCEYQSLNKSTVTKYGEGTQEEMCFGFITIYPAVHNFDSCSQWQDLPLCTLDSYLPFSGCDLINFTLLLEPIGKTCSRNCSDDCRGLIKSLKGTLCWDGQIQEFIKQFWPTFVNSNLSSLFTTIEDCSYGMADLPMKNSTKAPTMNFSEIPSNSSMENHTLLPTEIPSNISMENHTKTSTEGHIMISMESGSPNVVMRTNPVKDENGSPQPGGSTAQHEQTTAANKAVRCLSFWQNNVHIFACVILFLLRK